MPDILFAFLLLLSIQSTNIYMYGFCERFSFAPVSPLKMKSTTHKNQQKKNETEQKQTFKKVCEWKGEKVTKVKKKKEKKKKNRNKTKRRRTEEVTEDRVVFFFAELTFQCSATFGIVVIYSLEKTSYLFAWESVTNNSSKFISPNSYQLLGQRK